jgi:hypothetical protein
VALNYENFTASFLKYDTKARMKSTSYAVRLWYWNLYILIPAAFHLGNAVISIEHSKVQKTPWQLVLKLSAKNHGKFSN